MKIKRSVVVVCFTVLVLGGLSLSAVKAQTVGTIGVGDVVYSADDSQADTPKEKIIESIEAGLNKALAETRKFSVLNYQQLTDRLAKQGRSLSSYYDKSYSGTEYSQAGLDYILKVDVTEAGVYTKNRPNSKNAVGLVEMDFRLIGVADQTADFESGVTAQLTERVGQDEADPSDEVLQKTIEQAVDQLVDQVIASLFPVRVMQIADSGEIKLNFGSGLLSAGDTILIYAKGDEVVIDETGEIIGDSIATLQVVSVDTKFAKAQALSGFQNIEKGQEGYLLVTDG